MLSAPDAAVIRRDKALVGLATLLDPDAFRDALVAASPERGIEAAEPLYVRYKPGTSCLVAYRLRGADSDWHAYATTYAPRSGAKLEKARMRSADLVLESVAAVVRFFPHDRRLPALRQITDTGKRRRLLRKVLPERSELWEAALCELNYKPERRYVARLQAWPGRALLKVFAAADYPSARAAARTWVDSDTTHVARVLGRSRSGRICVLEWLEGTPLDELIRQGLPGRALRQVGEALAELHERDASDLPTAAPDRAVDAAADALAAICPDLARRAKRLAGVVAEELLRLPGDRVPAHGDFSSDQVVMRERSVGLLDLDNATLDHAAADLGSFFAQLERAAVAGELSAARAEELSTELVEGYRAGRRSDADPHAVGLYTAAALIRLSSEPFRHREPAWDERAAALLDRAERAVSARPSLRRPSRSAGTILEQIAQVSLDSTAYELRRAWPRGPGRLLLEYASTAGALVGGQWLPDSAKLERIAHATDGSSSLVAANGTRVLIHTGGADRRLPGLAPLLAAPGAELLVHRPERRAVVRLDRRGKRSYAKVVRPERVRELAATGSAARRLADGFRAPELLELDADTGVTIWSALEGESLYALTGQEGFLPAARAAGGALRALHAAAPPAVAALHSGEHEARWLEVWLERVESFALAVHRPARAAAGTVLAALARTSSPTVLLHRDFFDKQVIVDGQGRAGLLDFDTLAVGEAALDVANALVHFELRALQGLCPPGQAAEAAAEFLDAYGPQSEVLRRLDAYADATRLRLACLYAFRPCSADLPALLLGNIGQPLPGGNESAVRRAAGSEVRRHPALPREERRAR